MGFAYVCIKWVVLGNLVCLFFRLSEKEKLSDKLKCWNSASHFLGFISSPLRWLLSQFRKSGFEEYAILSSSLLYIGCIIGVYLLYAEASSIANLVTKTSNNYLKSCVYSIRVENTFHTRVVCGY